MLKARSLVGLDVHATKIGAAVLDAETGQLPTFGMSGNAARAAGFCAGLLGPVRVAYQAGPTGGGLARELERRGVQCLVAAPSKIPRACGDRVKTDRRDAEHLVRLLLAGKLHPVRVLGDEEEALRDLVRAREAGRVDLMRTRHLLSKLLLRHGIHFDDGKAWTDRHRQGLIASRFGRQRRRPRRSTLGARSMRSATAAMPWSARYSRSCRPRREQSRSGGCGAYAGSTR